MTKACFLFALFYLKIIDHWMAILSPFLGHPVYIYILDWTNWWRQRLLCHHGARRVGHLLVYQRAAHSWNICCEGQDLHLCCGGGRQQGVRSRVPPILHHRRPGGRVRVQVGQRTKESTCVGWSGTDQVWWNCSNCNREALWMERGSETTS